MVERVNGISKYDFTGLAFEIAEVAGIDAAAKLCAAHGGTQITIPAKLPDDDHWLVRCVGKKAAKEICRYAAVGDVSGNGRARGFRSVLLPLGPQQLYRRCRRQLDEYLIAGMSARRAARLCGVSERTAWNVKARLRDLGLVKRGLPSDKLLAARVVREAVEAERRKQAEDNARHRAKVVIALQDGMTVKEAAATFELSCRLAATLCQVANHAAQGRDAAQIAERTSFSPATVERILTAVEQERARTEAERVALHAAKKAGLQ